MKSPVCGSQSRSEFGPASNPSSVTTCPVGSSDMCTATSGHETGVLQLPSVVVSAAASCLRRAGVASVEKRERETRCARVAGRRGLLTQTTNDAAMLSVDLVNDYLCLSRR